MYPYINIFSRQVSTYSLCMIIGFYLATIFSVLRAKKTHQRPASVLVIAFFVLIGAISGAVLLYVFVTYPINEILPRLKNGTLDIGLVFYGGLIGGILFAFLGAKICRQKLYSYEKTIVPFIPLGHAVGRVGCLMAGCCYGVEYEGLGAVYYNLPAYGLYSDVGRFPVQPIEAFLDIIIMIYLIITSKKEKEKYDLLFTYLFLYSIMRFFTEMLRGDEIRGINFFSTSQWISIGIILLFAVRFIYKKLKK